MEIKKSKDVGLFIVCYDIISEAIGSSICHLRLTVNTPKEEVDGVAHIYNATVHPPKSIFSTITNGLYTYMCTMKDCHILVTAQGEGHIGTPITPLEGVNFKLRMVLDENWETGTAQYSYYDVNTQNWENGAGTVKKVTTM